MRTIELSRHMEFSDVLVQLTNKFRNKTGGKIDIRLSGALTQETLQKRLMDVVQTKIPDFSKWSEQSADFVAVNNKGNETLGQAWYTVGARMVLGQREVFIQEEDYARLRINERLITSRGEKEFKFYKKSNTYLTPEENGWEEVVDEKEKRKMLDDCAADLSTAVPANEVEFQKPSPKDLARRVLGVAA